MSILGIDRSGSTGSTTDLPLRETTPDAPATPEAPVFDVRKAANEKGFVDFLTQHSDFDTMDKTDPEEMGKKYEIYKAREGVAKRVVELLAQDIKVDLGVEYGKADLDSVKTHILQMSINDPDGFQELQAQLVNIVIEKAKYDEVNTKLTAIGGIDGAKRKLDDLKAKKASHALAIENRGVMGWVKSWGNKDIAVAREVTKSVGDTKESLQTSIRNIEEEIGKLELVVANAPKLEEAKRELDGLKAEMVDQLSVAVDVEEKIKDAIKDKFDKLVTSGKIDKLTEAQKMLENLIERRDAGVSSEILDDVVDDVAMQNRINDGVEVAARGELEKALNITKISNDQLKKIESRIQGLASKTELGPFKGPEVKQFLAETLNAIAGGLGNDPVSRAKKLYIAQIVSRMS